MFLSDCRLPDSGERLVNERKMVGSQAMAPVAIAVLNAAAQCDGLYPEGSIHSVYFDSPLLTSYYEKANGDNIKAKLRLRWYDDRSPDSATIPAYLEVKGRLGSARLKERVKVDIEARILRQLDLCAPQWSSLLAEFAKDLPTPIDRSWVPSVCISYKRRRYVCPATGTRAAIDWNVVCDRANTLLFPFTAPIHLEESLCEFKNPTGTPPPWLEDIFALGYKLGSHSKYSSCIEKLLTLN